MGGPVAGTVVEIGMTRILPREVRAQDRLADVTFPGLAV
jgi:hypothetical protein